MSDRRVTTFGHAPLDGEPIMWATGCRVGEHLFVKIGVTDIRLSPFDVCCCGAVCYDGVPSSVQRWWSRDGMGPWVEHRR